MSGISGYPSPQTWTGSGLGRVGGTEGGLASSQVLALVQEGGMGAWVGWYWLPSLHSSCETWMDLHSAQWAAGSTAMPGLARGVRCLLFWLLIGKLLSGVWPQDPWGPHRGGGTWYFVICPCL